MPSRLLLCGLLLCAWLPGQDLVGDPDTALADLLRTTAQDRDALTQRYSLRGASCLTRLHAFSSRRWQQLEQLPFAELSRARQLDYIVFGSWLQRELAGLEDEALRLAELADVFPWVSVLVDLSEADRQAVPWDYAELSRRLQAMQKGLASQEVSGSPQLVRAARGWTGRGIDLCKQLRKEQLPRDPLLGWWLAEPLEAVQKGLEDYAAKLDESLEQMRQQAGNIFAIGEEAFALELERHAVPHTPRSLLAFGQEQFAAIEAELQREAEKIAPGEPWQTALQLVKQDIAEPGQQRVEVAALAREAIDFVRTQRLFRVPELCAEIWYLTPIDREAQQRFPFAYYSGNRMGVAYAEDGMAIEGKWQAMLGNNRHFTRNVVPHELIPGHHLQRFYADRYNAQRKPYSSTPFYVEGHGLYTELLLDEQGFFRTPEERMGSLFWRLIRAARIIVSTRYHLGEMQQQEMVDFLIEKVGLEESGARGEVDRYMTYSPLYQAAYLTGAHQILALRESCREAWGDGFNLESFHEAFLRQGALPIVWIEDYLCGRPLSPDQIWLRPAREIGYF